MLLDAILALAALLTAIVALMERRRNLHQITSLRDQLTEAMKPRTIHYARGYQDGIEMGRGRAESERTHTWDCAYNAGYAAAVRELDTQEFAPCLRTTETA